MANIDVMDQLQRASRISALLMGIGALVILSAFWLSYEQLRSLQSEVDVLTLQKKKKVEEIKTATEILLALNPLLRDFGWSAKRIPKDINDSLSIKRSLEANEELGRLSLQSRELKAKGIIVEYYPKDIDGEKVRSALTDFGFRVVEKNPLITDIPANDIVFGTEVKPEYAKVIAYVLMRAGVEIKGIHQSRLPGKTKVIQVVTNRIVANRPPLTVEAVRQTYSFDQDPI